MVQLLLSRAAGDAGPAEGVLLELQGELEARGGGGAGLAGRLLGDLHYTGQGAPVLVVGHHILHGKVVALEKPLAVLARAAPPGEPAAGPPRYAVAALVRRKLLFKARPKPIVAGAAGKA